MANDNILEFLLDLVDSGRNAADSIYSVLTYEISWVNDVNVTIGQLAVGGLLGALIIYGIIKFVIDILP